MKIVLVFLGLITGWLVAFFVEKRYVSRASQICIILPAFLASGGGSFVANFLDTYDFRWAWDTWELHVLVKIYLCFGVLLGILAFALYIAKVRCRKKFYQLSYWAYSSKTVMPLVTTLAIFSNYWPELLYEGEFWVTCGGFFVLAWFPIITIATVCIATAYFVYQDWAS